jgi:hypothetical protein
MEEEEEDLFLKPYTFRDNFTRPITLCVLVLTHVPTTITKITEQSAFFVKD